MHVPTISRLDLKYLLRHSMLFTLFTLYIYIIDILVERISFPSYTSHFLLKSTTLDLGVELQLIYLHHLQRILKSAGTVH